MGDNEHVDDRPVPTVDEVERRLRPILAGEVRVQFAYLFGSVASGENRQTSDVDVAVMLEPGGTRRADAPLHDHVLQRAIGVRERNRRHRG